MAKAWRLDVWGAGSMIGVALRTRVIRIIPILSGWRGDKSLLAISACRYIKPAGADVGG